MPAGRIGISWERTTIDDVEYFDFEWRETGGPEVVAPSRQGFGSRVIKDMMAAEFGGTIDLSFDPAGVTFKLRSPLKESGLEDPLDVLTAI